MEGIRFGKREPIEARVTHTERLYNSALILNRVGEDTSAATRGSDELADAVEIIREAACEATYALAGEEGADPAECLETIREALERARASVAGRRGAADPEDARRHVFQAAMVFGLGEVMDSLGDLVEAGGEK